jgi:hypothetical protein
MLTKFSLFLCLTLSLISIQSFGQNDSQRQISIDSIKNELLQLSDSSEFSIKRKAIINDMILMLNKDSLFPHSDFDSVIFVSYKIDKSKEPLEWNNQVNKPVIRFKKLTEEEVEKVIVLVNSPQLFDWSECATQTIESEIQFFLSDMEIAKISISCMNTQLICTPNNKLTKWGALKDRSNSSLLNFID